MRIVPRRLKSAARSRAAAAASATALAAAFSHAGSPGLGRRAAPGKRRVGSRIFMAISGRARGQRSRRARVRSNTQSARISASAGGASGTAANARPAALAAAETGLPSPAPAFRLKARPFGSTARSNRAAASKIRPGSRLGGRPALLLQRDNRVAAGPSGSPIAKRRSRSAAASALRGHDKIGATAYANLDKKGT